MTKRVFIVTTEHLVTTHNFVMAENEKEAKSLYKKNEYFDEIEESKELKKIVTVEVEGVVDNEE